MTDPDVASAALDPLKQQALAWVDHLVSGEATAQDADAVKSWRAQSSAHARAFAEAVHLRRALGPAVQTLAEEGGRSTDLGLSLVRRSVVSRSYASLGGLVAASAATAAEYLMARLPLRLWPSLAEFKADYWTGNHEQRRIALAGGGSIELNAQTSTAICSTMGSAGIESVSGESAARSELKPE